jgi:DNA-binding transcriptional ArsR family regulator
MQLGLPAWAQPFSLPPMSNLSQNPVPANTLPPLAVALDPMKVFGALAVPLRWQIFQKLATGEFSAGAMVGQVGSGLENVSRHLRRLTKAGVVKSRRGADGRSPLYSIPAAFQVRPGMIDYGCCIVRIPGVAGTELGGKD